MMIFIARDHVGITGVYTSYVQAKRNSSGVVKRVFIKKYNKKIK